jgi:hypothetical protein
LSVIASSDPAVVSGILPITLHPSTSYPLPIPTLLAMTVMTVVNRKFAFDL